ncbi:MAG: IS66 family transposase [Calditrichaeota bacterium]|nr:IS66 family transposase [Calditrichota bacterium]
MTQDQLDTLKASLELLREDPDRLIEIILHQAQSIFELRAEIDRLKARIEELEQKPPGSTAPFRIPEAKRVKEHRKPGRKKGHKGHYREAPPITERIQVPLNTCPCCGGELSEVEPIRQVIEEIPPVQLRVVELTTYSGQCRNCGSVRSSHPLQVSLATGAAGTHLGPNALSIMTLLQHRWHLSKRKSCRILKELFGLHITPGGLVSATHRISDKLADIYHNLQNHLRSSDVLHSDETGWYVGAPGYMLWVFTNARATLYKVVKSRSREQLQQVIGPAYEGVLVSDCLSVYDDASPHQHKCYSHHLKAISEAIKKHPQNGDGFLKAIQRLLKTAMILKEVKPDHPPEQYEKMCQSLEQNADRLLNSIYTDPLEQTVQKRLFKQRDHLFTFLYHDAVDATNNLAERQLRPAVIARKISCGNRTGKGARTWEILASIAATCAQTGQSMAQIISKSMVLQPDVLDSAR